MQPLPHLPATQICEPPQLVPSTTLEYAVTDLGGWQLWHALFGSSALGASTAPPTKQPAAQTPAPHTWAAPQVVPSATLDQPVVARSGWHDWQVLPGLTMPGR